QKQVEARVTELEAEIAELENALGPGEDAQQIVSQHIKLLHRYNEAKDAAQIIIGKVCYIQSSTILRDTCAYMQLAAHKQTTIRQIHEDYGLTDED
ncbi:hypothetical protein BC834DRAFT_827536, partial [Gloeopeniophorella convolvens]